MRIENSHLGDSNTLIDVRATLYKNMGADRRLDHSVGITDIFKEI